MTVVLVVCEYSEIEKLVGQGRLLSVAVCSQGLRPVRYAWPEKDSGFSCRKVEQVAEVS